MARELPAERPARMIRTDRSSPVGVRGPGLTILAAR